MSLRAASKTIKGIDQLTSTIAIQSEIITKLSSQLGFVLSFLDIEQDTGD
jgi:hypothetical protein